MRKKAGRVKYLGQLGLQIYGGQVKSTKRYSAVNDTRKRVSILYVNNWF
jgi:hypothetical protein